MSRLQLSAQKREFIGRKVKRLRAMGIIPANLYGPNVESLALQLPLGTFRKALRESGGTDLIELTVEGEKDVRPVLISQVQLDPVRNVPLHVDLYQVNLSGKVKVSVPLEFVNEDKTSKAGIVIELLTELELESYPDRIPRSIEVDLSVLQQVGDTVMVGDLVLPEGTEVQANSEEPVVKLNPLEETLKEEQERMEAEVVPLEEEVGQEVGVAEETSVAGEVGGESAGD